VTDAQCIAEEMNNYFCNIGSSIAKKITPPKKSFSHYSTNPVKSSFFYNNIDPTEVCNMIATLKMKKTTGIDLINANLLHDVSHVVSYPLAYIYNLSLTSGSVPENLKIAKVVPIFKKGETDLPSNYRPISLLTIFK